MVLSRSLELQHHLRTQESWSSCTLPELHFRKSKNSILFQHACKGVDNSAMYAFSSSNAVLDPTLPLLSPFLFFFSFSTKTFPLSAWNRKKRHQCVRRGDDSDDAANSKEKEMIEMDRLPIWRPEIANYGDSRMTTLCSSLFYFALYILPCALLKKHWF